MQIRSLLTVSDINILTREAVEIKQTERNGDGFSLNPKLNTSKGIQVLIDQNLDAEVAAQAVDIFADLWVSAQEQEDLKKLGFESKVFYALNGIIKTNTLYKAAIIVDYDPTLIANLLAKIGQEISDHTAQTPQREKELREAIQSTIEEAMNQSQHYRTEIERINRWYDSGPPENLRSLIRTLEQDYGIHFQPDVLESVRFFEDGAFLKRNYKDTYDRYISTLQVPEQLMQQADPTYQASSRQQSEPLYQLPQRFAQTESLFENYEFYKQPASLITTIQNGDQLEIQRNHVRLFQVDLSQPRSLWSRFRHLDEPGTVSAFLQIFQREFPDELITENWRTPDILYIRKGNWWKYGDHYSYYVQFLSGKELGINTISHVASYPQLTSQQKVSIIGQLYTKGHWFPHRIKLFDHGHNLLLIDFEPNRRNPFRVFREDGTMIEFKDYDELLALAVNSNNKPAVISKAERDEIGDMILNTWGYPPHHLAHGKVD